MGGKKNAKYAKKDTTIRKVARQEAKKVVNKEVETKYNYNYSDPGGGHGYISVGASVATGAVAQSVTLGLAHGTGEAQFIGDKIRPAFVKISYNIANRPSTDEHNLVRLIVIQAKGGTVPSINLVLHSAGNMATPLSPYDQNYKEQYTVLYDKTYNINGYTTYPSSDSCQKYGTIYIKGKKMRLIAFNNSTVAVTANDIYFYAVSDSTVDYHPRICYWTTLAYKDA